MKGNVALLLGPEEGEKQDWIEREKAALFKTYPDMETLTVYAFESDGSDIEEALYGLSLFASHTLVTVKHLEEAKRGVIDALVSFIKKPTEEAHLFLVSEALSLQIPSEIVKAVPKENQIVFWELFENKKREWITSYFKKAGFSITSEATSALLELVENNTRELKNISEQLIIFFKSDSAKKTVTEDDISRYVSHTREESGYTLFLYIADRDYERSLAAIARILDSKSAPPLMIISALMRQFRLLESYMVLRKNGSDEEAFDKARPLKLSEVPEGKGGVKKKDRPLFKKAAAYYSLQDVSRIIKLLEREDIQIRKIPQEQDRCELELLVKNIIFDRGEDCPLSLECELMDNSLRHTYGN